MFMLMLFLSLNDWGCHLFIDNLDCLSIYYVIDDVYHRCLLIWLWGLWLWNGYMNVIISYGYAMNSMIMNYDEYDINNESY